MQRVSFILGVLVLTACAVVNEVEAIVCKNGGTCNQKNVEECLTCSCLTGFTGTDCGTILMKVTGLVSYNTSGASASNVSKNDFENRLKKVIFPGSRYSTVDVKTSKSFIVASFVVYVQRPAAGSTFDADVYQSDRQVQLVDQLTTDAAFFNSVGINVSSASTDVDECVSDLYSCMENAECYNTANGYGCTCKVGFIENNDTCTEIYCFLSNAPTWPSSATRTVTYPNGTIASNLGKNVKMPYKTFIAYRCPERHSLVNEVTGKAQTDIIECVGNREPTHKNSGWTGSNVRCDMIIEFTVAIIVAVVSSAIIVLVGGAFVVSCTKKKPAEDDTDTVVLEMDNGIMPGHIPR